MDTVNSSNTYPPLKYPFLQPLPRLTSLQDPNNEYADRFSRITSPYLLDKNMFVHAMLRTEAFISGHIALMFIHPSVPIHGKSLSLPSMELYVSNFFYNELLLHLILYQNYKVTGTRNTTKPDGTHHMSPHLRGIKSITFLKSTSGRITLITANHNQSPILPLFNLPTTLTMNLLSPNYFISLYPELTLNGQGLINSTSYRFYNTHAGNIASLRRPAYIHIALYRRMGYVLKNTVQELDDTHLAHCKNKRCRLYRYSDDPTILRISYGEVNTMSSTSSPLYPLAVWSLGGYECGRHNGTGVYESHLGKIIRSTFS